MRSGLHWAGLIKEHFPHIPLLFGGVDPTVQPLECIHNPLIDIICIGEGEYAVLECLERLEHNELPYDVDGIWFKDKKGTTIKNKLRPFIEDLDALPFPDWDLWDIDLYIQRGGFFRNSLKVLSSRGCFHNCNFCTGPVIKKNIPGRYYRLRSPHNVIAEIKRNVSNYYDRGLRYTNFADPIFGATKQHFSELARLYTQEGLNKIVPWVCETHAEVITESWAVQAARAGCMVVSLGIEAADDVLRQDTLGKPLPPQQIREAIRNLEHHNIMYMFYLMLGMPGETIHTAMRTIKLSLRFNPIKTYFLYFLPLPKTPLYDECKNIRITHKDTKFDDGYWNRPNIKVSKIGRWGFILLSLYITLIKIYLFIRKGWQLRKFTLIKDVFSLLFVKNKLLSSSNPYGLNELYQNTILKYYFEDAYDK